MHLFDPLNFTFVKSNGSFARESKVAKVRSRLECTRMSFLRNGVFPGCTQHKHI